MKDPRYAKLADVLVGYSCSAQTDENVLVEAYDVPDEIVETLVARIAQAGARPFVTIKHNAVLRALYQSATEKQMQLAGEIEAKRMAQMDAYIGVRGASIAPSCQTSPMKNAALPQTLVEPGAYGIAG